MEGSAWQALELCSLLSMGTDWCSGAVVMEELVLQSTEPGAFFTVSEIEAVPLVFMTASKGLRMAG